MAVLHFWMPSISKIQRSWTSERNQRRRAVKSFLRKNIEILKAGSCKLVLIAGTCKLLISLLYWKKNLKKDVQKFCTPFYLP